jgi:enoyl-CoA hydratase/carnithine racemase
MTEQIKIENAENILTLTFARPDKKNALTNVMHGALADAIVAAETDQAARAIVIRGEGDMFTAGNDVGEFAAIATGAFQGERHVARFVQAIARATRPLIAAVQGRAVGIGTTMLLHCDFVLLAENAQLLTPFVNLALVPEAASSLLMPMRVGYARAYEMFALGEPVDAKTALAIGIAKQGCAAGQAACRGRRFRPAPCEAAGRLARRDQAADAQSSRADGANRRRNRALLRTAEDRRGARSVYRVRRAKAAGLYQICAVRCTRMASGLRNRSAREKLTSARARFSGRDRTVGPQAT